MKRKDQTPDQARQSIDSLFTKRPDCSTHSICKTQTDGKTSYNMNSYYFSEMNEDLYLDKKDIQYMYYRLCQWLSASNDRRATMPYTFVAHEPKVLVHLINALTGN